MKYHIFIGSTLDDLKNERKEIFRIIMELGHVPVSAEFLDGSSKNHHLFFTKTIEECDYLIALIAHKYAPLEHELDIAEKYGIPVISLIIDEKARWKASKKEKEPENIKKLGELKKRMSAGIHETWLNSADLCMKVQSQLIHSMNLIPQRGWVRADMAITPMITNEITRLSVENTLLKRQIEFDEDEHTLKLRIQMKNDAKVLALNKIIISFYYTNGENWENSRQFRYLRLFKLLVPEMSVGKTTQEISRFLGTVLNPDLERTVRKDFPTPSNTVKKIMADFAMLKLVKCINADEITNSASQGEDEIWDVTEYGKELFEAYRMRQMKKALPVQEDE